MKDDNEILIGAVAYAPKAVTIWEGIRSHFLAEGAPMDFVLFSNYERQVESLLAGTIDIAWNTPLAHVRAHGRSRECTALGMRDSDRGFTSVVVARKDRGLRSINDLEERSLAVGSRDSTQANLLPLHFLHAAGVDLDKVNVISFDSDMGKHGDTGSSEYEVLSALTTGLADAGAIGKPIWLAERDGGRIEPGMLEVLWETPPFDHCMFDAAPGLPERKVAAFKKGLFSMSWENPAHREILELEGLKEWLPPREEGYDSLRAALAKRS